MASWYADLRSRPKLRRTDQSFVHQTSAMGHQECMTRGIVAIEEYEGYRASQTALGVCERPSVLTTMHRLAQAVSQKITWRFLTL